VLDADSEAEGTITVDNVINVSDVDVTAAEGNVEVIANCEDDTSDAYIYADAFNDVDEPDNVPLIATNTATVDITAGQDVKVMAFDGGYAEISALAEVGIDNTAGVTINTLDGKVLVHAVDADASIMAEAYEGDDNLATIDIDAVGGDVAVVDIGEGGENTAKIEAIAEDATNSNTADIQITATATTSEYEEEGDENVYAEVNGGDVKVVAKDGGHAEIRAYAADAEAEDSELDTASNTANVTILTNSAEGSYQGELLEEAKYEYDPDLEVDVLVEPAVYDVETYTDGGDVKVEAENGGEAAILAEALGSDENTAGVEINAGGNIDVIAEDGDASIRAYASNDDEMNAANIILNAVEDITVMGKWGGEAQIFAEASAGYDNTAGIQISTEDGDVLVHGIDGDASIEALARWADNTNTATVDIDVVGGDVKVIDIGEGGKRSSEILATAEYAGLSNSADIQITATATTSEYKEDGRTYVDVDGGDVKVIAKDGGHAEITAYAADAEAEVLKGDSISLLQDEEPEIDPTSNTANVTIHTYSAEGIDYEIVEPPVSTSDEPPSKEPLEYEKVVYTDGGDVKVEAENGSEAAIQAVTTDSGNNDSDVLICAEGEVLVSDENSQLSTAKILSSAQFGNINDAYTGVRGAEGISLLGDNGQALIGSEAQYGSNSNTAYTLLCTDGDVLVDAVNWGIAKVTADASSGEFNTADIDLLSIGDVTLTAENNSEAKVRAKAKDGEENNSHVGIWADGDVEVSGITGSMARIEAKAKNGFDNDAEVTVVAGGDISVTAVEEGKAKIEAITKNAGNQSNAYVGLWTDGDVLVNGYDDGEARVQAEAADGIDNTADVAVCAEGDVLVASGFNLEDTDFSQDLPDGTGGSATIKAVAKADSETGLVKVWDEEANDGEGGWIEVEVNTSADANVKVVSHEGGVAVIDITGENIPADTAVIEAEAYDAYSNTADVGVAAGGEIMDGSLTEDGTFYDMFYDWTEMELNQDLGLGVLVAGLGYDSKASIFAYAHDGVENTADVVVCAPETVAVIANADNDNDEGSNPFAQIKARAGAYGESDDYDATNTAKTQVYAGDVAVSLPTIARGRGIWASAVDTDGSPHVDSEFLMTAYDDEFGTGEFVWTIDNFEGDTDYEGGDDSATLIIKDYSEAVDCPTCDPRPAPPECPDCGGEVPPPVPPLPPAPLGVAPLPATRRIPFGQGGCPALMEWLANEVGVAVDVQVFVANAFVSSTDCQPCETAARLKAAATILTDEDGSHMAAMNQVFTELMNTMTLSAPFTPEMANSVAAALTDSANTGPQYAAAREYIDAFVQYIAILNTDMGSPVADSVAYVMEKYGSDVSGNPIMADFLAARLQSGETFAQ
jgi:galactitol-specific phosphotransferase system IIB component